MKKKAYTLTELLVVVMIIAVLAAVVLPKFNKVLETRKTTEAEDLMTAIRQEQEYRCAADRPYAENMANLKSVASAKAKNYTLALTGTGVEAKRNGKSYQLSIPSYADGRICCDDINDSGLCAELNRDYPTCTELRNKADFKTSPEDCVPLPPPPPPCTEGAKEYADCSNSCGMSGTRLVNECVGGLWQARNGSCSVTDSQCSCNAVSGDQPPDRQETCNKCGTRTVTYNCGGAPNWQWVSSPGACSVEAGHCPCDDGDKPSTEQSCSSCGGKQTRTMTCNDGTWVPGAWGSCSKPESECETCEDTKTIGNGFRIHYANGKPIMMFPEGLSDTCDDNFEAEFSCSGQDLEEFSCVDVYRIRESGGSSGSGGSCSTPPHFSCPLGQTSMCVNGTMVCVTSCPSGGCYGGTTNPMPDPGQATFDEYYVYYAVAEVKCCAVEDIEDDF